MSTLLEEPNTQHASEASHQLRTTMAAVRVSISWLGIRKSLTTDQRAQAADTFGATGDFLSAGKKLLDNRHPAYKAVTAVRNRIVSFWKAMSLPYPEPGIRLIRQDRIETFNAQMVQLREELEAAVEQLDDRYGELRAAARQRLGSLFSEADYPTSLRAAFGVQWDFPSVEPPDYLRQLNPDLYQQECHRIQERFNEAVRLAEEAFTAELAKLVSHLTERLSGHEDGKPRIFRDSAVGNLTDFFERFRELNVRSSQELEQLVAQCQRIVRGVAPQDLRDREDLRQHVATQLAGVQSVLDGLLVDWPRRRILRSPK